MLEPIDFLRNPDDQNGYFLNPKKILEQIGEIMDDDCEKWSSDTRCRFALLCRALWTISVLDTVDNYDKYTENDVATFFLAFDVLNDIIDRFDRVRAGPTNIFRKTLLENVFTGDVVKSRDDYKFTRFIRALSVAHTAGVNNREGFLQKGCIFTLLRIDVISAAPTNAEIANSPKAFYFHAVLSEKDENNGKSIIFKVFIDELKDYLKTKYENCNFKKLKR